MRKLFLCQKVLPFFLMVLFFLGLYLTYQTYGNFSFAFQIRGKKLLAFLVVGVATTFATISFQTLTQNQFLTPNILGLDSLYVFFHTVLVVFFGGVSVLQQEAFTLFLLNLILMAGASLLFGKVFLKWGKHHLFLLLMIGMICGTFFRSFSTFFQVLLDPNEYDLLQGKLFASFSNVDTSSLFVSTILVFLLGSLLMKSATKLDVFHLGLANAQSLGVDVFFFQLQVLVLVSLLTAIATALVGPVTFLGFIVANITYQTSQTYRHVELFVMGTLWSWLLLIGGQFLLEHLFHLQTTLSVVIEFGGGLYFIMKLLLERKKAW